MATRSNDAGHGADVVPAVFALDDDDERWLAFARDADHGAPLGQLGPFEILDEVNRTRHAIVFRARQPNTNRSVALKLLRFDEAYQADLAQRFAREIQALLALQHPNIVRVYEVGGDDHRPMLAMEWIDGNPLDEWIAATHPDTAMRLRVFLQIADAVHHAHLTGVIHRDIKPSNILVDASGAPHVLDFGIAKLTHEDPLYATNPTQFVGTPAYAAPEQLGAFTGQSDARTDVYALGVLLYQTLTGALPYTLEGGLARTVETITTHVPSPPSRQCPGITRELDLIVLKALAKDPIERYQSVESFAADLRRYLAGEAVLAHPPRTLYLASKLIQRHKLSTALLMVLLTSLIAFAMVTTVLLWRVAEQRQVASTASALAEENARNAEAQRAATERVNQFLGEILSAASPTHAGADGRLLDLLDAAARRAESQFADRPELLAETLYTIGYTYRTLWRWRSAEPHLERALALYRERTGPPDEPLARCMTTLGTVYTARRNAEAVTLQRSALKLRDELYAEPHPLRALSRQKLAYALYMVERRWEEAEDLLQEALAMFRATRGELHRDVGSCLHNLAYLHVRRRSFAAAADVYQRAVTIFEQLDDPDDPFYAECLFGFCFQLERLERFAEAVEIAERGAPLVDRLFGQSMATPLRGLRVRCLAASGQMERALTAQADLIARQADPVPESLAPHDGAALASIRRHCETPGAQTAYEPHAALLDEIAALSSAPVRSRLLTVLSNRFHMLTQAGATTAAQQLWERFRKEVATDVTLHALALEGLAELAWEQRDIHTAATHSSAAAKTLLASGTQRTAMLWIEALEAAGLATDDPRAAQTALGPKVVALAQEIGAGADQSRRARRMLEVLAKRE